MHDFASLSFILFFFQISVRDEYITTFAAVSQTYGLDVGLMAVSPNGTLTQTGTIGDYFASESDFSISISDSGQYYIGLMDLSGTNFQNLLLLNITAYPFNITGQYLMSWTLETNQGAVQLNVEDPFLINTPYTDDYLLVAEAQAASVGTFPSFLFLNSQLIFFLSSRIFPNYWHIYCSGWNASSQFIFVKSWR